MIDSPYLFKVDRLPIIVVVKKYNCVVTHSKQSLNNII